MALDLSTYSVVEELNSSLLRVVNLDVKRVEVVGLEGALVVS